MYIPQNLVTWVRKAPSVPCLAEIHVWSKVKNKMAYQIWVAFHSPLVNVYLWDRPGLDGSSPFGYENTQVDAWCITLLNVCVYLCVCMYLYVFHVCMCISVCTLCMHLQVSVCTCAFCICIYICVRTCVYMCLCVCVYQGWDFKCSMHNT